MTKGGKARKRWRVIKAPRLYISLQYRFPRKTEVRTAHNEANRPTKQTNIEDFEFMCELP